MMVLSDGINSKMKGINMKEEWIELEEFPDYAVSNLGNILCLRNDLVRRPSQNQQGIAKITLVLDGRTHTRAVAVLVAKTFLKRDASYLRDPNIFNTPINTDGDRMNCCVDNLMWRPRWFAIKYHQQFQYIEFHQAHPYIEEIETGERFNNIKDPSINYGLYYRDIIKSFMNHVYVFPTGQEFRLV